MSRVTIIVDGDEGEESYLIRAQGVRGFDAKSDYKERHDYLPRAGRSSLPFWPRTLASVTINLDHPDTVEVRKL